MRVPPVSAILEFLKAAFSNMNKSDGGKLLTLTMHIAKINEKIEKAHCKDDRISETKGCVCYE